VVKSCSKSSVCAMSNIGTPLSGWFERILARRSRFETSLTSAWPLCLMSLTFLIARFSRVSITMGGFVDKRYELFEGLPGPI
jgi:hypothetical protein